MVIITTCNRETLLKNLLGQIAQQYTGVVMVVDDGTDNEIKFDDYPFELMYHRFEFRHGKRRYYEVISYIFAQLQSIEFDYLWQLPDDVSISPNFFRDSLNLWNTIEDANKICLSTGHTDLRHTEPCWTEFVPQKISEEIYLTNWMDMCYLCERKMLEALKWDVEKPDTDAWKRNPSLGSRVGSNISKRLMKLGLRMFHVNHSLVEFIPTQTRMHE